MKPEPRLGRPPIVDVGIAAKVNVRVAPADYDRMHARAARDGVSVPEVIRRAIRRDLADGDDD